MIGLLLAVALDRKLRGRNLFRAIFYGPAVLPLVAVGMIWAWTYNPQFGFINVFLQAIGLGQFYVDGSPFMKTALPATFLTAVWGGIGFPMVLYLAVLQAIPGEQYEAAKMDGANARQLFFKITLPWLREANVIVFSLAVISSFKTFDLIYTMTYGGPGRITQVLGTWMYFQSFQYYHAGYGAAIAGIIALITLIMAIPYIQHMLRDLRSRTAMQSTITPGTEQDAPSGKNAGAAKKTKRTASMKGEARNASIMIYVILGFMALVWLVPFVFIVLTSVRSMNDLISNGVFAWPKQIVWANFVRAGRSEISRSTSATACC